MKVIGITGITGSGKSTALACWRELGGCVLDCDEIYHTLLSQDEALVRAIAERFPAAMEGGSLSRKKLGKLVFADPKELEALNAITHPAVFTQVLERLDQAAAAGYDAAAIDAIGLFESGLQLLCHTTVAVTAPESVRIARLQQRDGVSEAYARARIAAQRSDEDYCSLCRHVLRNDGDLESFQAQCRALFTTILQERSFHCERE